MKNETHKIAILGFGKEGQSALAFLKREPAYRNTEIWVLDGAEKLSLPRGIRSRLGKDYLKGLEEFDLVIRGPGIKFHLPELVRARKQGVAFTTPTRLFFGIASTRTSHLIGVTGTKGKGTTSTLITRILEASGKKVFLAGNIGKPALDFLPKINKDSWVVLEMSSFQLMDLTQSPHVGVALMITSEHLDWHKTTAEYRTAKSNIVRFQKSSDFAVLAGDHAASRAYAKITKARTYIFMRKTPVTPGTYVQDGAFWFTEGKKKEKVCDIGLLQIPGEHNWENVGAAITVAKILKVPNSIIARAIQNFKGLEHRLEFAAEKKGVRYYDDSYATTPEGAQAALVAFTKPEIAILGGSSKGADFTKLGRYISKAKNIKAIIGIGVEWPQIKACIKNPDILLVEGCKNMKEVIRAAAKVAKPGDVVLLSPGCASFGMFKNYNERGDQFKKEARSL